MLTILALALTQIILAVILADFCSGTVHWVQDRYSLRDRSLLDRIVILYAKQHHVAPQEFIKLSWWERNSTPMVVVGSLLILMWLMDFLYWQAILFIVLFMFSGEIHLWSHRSPEQNGKIITYLQWLRIVQRPSHHRRHHSGEEGCYCVITQFLNPALNWLGAFSFLEVCVGRLFGILPEEHEHTVLADEVGNATLR